jgi:hypothetical protein
VIFYRQHEYRTLAAQNRSPDPNLPPLLSEFSRDFLDLIWEFPGNDLSRPLVSLMTSAGGNQGIYLGFDERGTWVQNSNWVIYAWSFKTWKLELVAQDSNHLPKAALARLHRPDAIVAKTAPGQ